MGRAIFVGLCTLDVIQLVSRPPGGNEKVVALRQTVAAGGPATNAAVTCAHLGGDATLVTAVGRHPLAAGIRADLDGCGVRVRDLTPERAASPATSTILVTADSGDRSVVSTNAIGLHVVPPDDCDWAGVTALQVDGHHPEVALAALRAARAAGIPTIMDGGSWKDGTARLLPLIDVIACSADFRPPGGVPIETALRDVPWVAITAGAGPIRWWGPGGRRGEVPVPRVDVVDTLGAGDVFHGALTHGIAVDGLGDFPGLLARAARVAARACASFGTRSWMHHTDTWMTGAV
ncbi:PfkB family carbohydrate kinase [Catenuloplanes sp. NPDC051500]|uniref:PfkB family carbohydrate kinase n=1 Tax=Catenuloplanes sp. NPDC051500 TaxID=3363959 RepID=UPI00379FFDFE